MNPKETAVKLALKKMFSERYFSICVIDALCSLTNTIPDSETYKIFKAIHCVEYGSMDPDFRRWLFDAVIKMFNSDGFDLAIIESMDPFYTKTLA